MSTDRNALTATVKALLSFVATSDAALGTRGNDLRDAQTFMVKESVTFGTADGKANQVWHDLRILAGSQTDALDLSGTALATLGGHDIAATVLRALFIHNRSDETLTAAAHGTAHTATAASLEVTVPANGCLWLKAATDALILGPGAWFLWYDPVGIEVAAGTADLLDIIETTGAEAAYDIVMLFEEADT